MKRRLHMTQTSLPLGKEFPVEIMRLLAHLDNRQVLGCEVIIVVLIQGCPDSSVLREMRFIVDTFIEIEWIDGRICGRWMAEAELAAHVVFQNVSCGPGLIGISSSGLVEASSPSVCI